jgi:hypothetical protein
MDRACSSHGRDRKCIQYFGGKNHKEIDRLGYVGIDGRITQWILKK